MNRAYLIPVLAAAIGGPYFYFDGSEQVSDWLKKKPESRQGEFDLQQFTSLAGNWQDGSQLGLDGAPVTGLPPGAERVDTKSIEFTPMIGNLAEVFRFDVTPAWIKSYWPRVTVAHGAEDLICYRVPLVTGPNPFDLTGSLTYSFDANMRVQRIAFHGFTEDPTRIVYHAKQVHGLGLDKIIGNGWYSKRFGQDVKSVLGLQHGVHASGFDSSPQTQVTMEINHPYGSYRLSRETQQAVDATRLSARRSY
jgi:hypothetical protein